MEQVLTSLNHHVRLDPETTLVTVRVPVVQETAGTNLGGPSHVDMTVTLADLVASCIPYGVAVTKFLRDVEGAPECPPWARAETRRLLAEGGGG